MPLPYTPNQNAGYRSPSETERPSNPGLTF